MLVEVDGYLRCHLGVAEHFKAIVAMTRNRVIGRENKLPWHLPEELKWFKQMTLNQVVVMGRKTFESIGKPLPKRETIVVSRGGFSFPGVRTVSSVKEIEIKNDPREFFIIGGAQLFQETLHLCSNVYLTLVKREVEGDTFLPRFEDDFELVETVRSTPDFDTFHYRNKGLCE